MTGSGLAIVCMTSLLTAGMAGVSAGDAGTSVTAEISETVEMSGEISEAVETGGETAETVEMRQENAAAVNATASRLGIEWDALPSSYEFVWDNSESCWYYGIWVDGICYKTPIGTYSTDVRHKMQLYCDGEYAYLHIIIGRNFEEKFNGEDYEFWIGNKIASFQIEYLGGGAISGNTADLPVGTHQVEVRHASGDMSFEVVPDSLAYYTKYENDVNAELELRIPLSEMKRQNPNINLENMGEIKFITPNLMYRFLAVSGADTLPLLSAGAAFLLVPVSSAALRKRFRKKSGK